MRSADVEVVVVGAGVMGLAAAHALARSGREILVLEQFELGHERGSSHGSSRIVRLSYPAVEWVRLAQESYPLWRRLEAEWGGALLELYGTLDLGDWRANEAALDACGVASEVLERAELERRFGIRVAPGERGLFQADGGVAYAERALQALADGARAAGAEIRERARVESIEEEAGGVSIGAMRARAALVTAGAWAPSLVPVDATPTRETTTYFEFAEMLPSVIDTTTAAGPAYALLAPGVGLKVGLHQTGHEADPDEPGAPEPWIAEHAAEWLARRLPAAGELLASETCLYTVRAGDEFLLERRGRVVVGSPCSGHGFKFAPVIGQRLARLVEEALAAS